MTLCVDVMICFPNGLKCGLPWNTCTRYMITFVRKYEDRSFPPLPYSSICHEGTALTVLKYILFNVPQQLRGVVLSCNVPTLTWCPCFLKHRLLIALARKYEDNSSAPLLYSPTCRSWSGRGYRTAFLPLLWLFPWCVKYNFPDILPSLKLHIFGKYFTSMKTFLLMWKFCGKKTPR